MRRPKYVSPSKRKAKVPANLDEVDSTINTPSLPKGVPMENSVVGWVMTMNVEDWNLADRVKFPHLTTDALMDRKIEGTVKTLQPKTWLQKVDKSRLLFLSSIPHFLQPPITMLVINQLLCLIHEDILWVGKPVCITAELVHQVSHLPCDGRDPWEITDKGNDVVMIERLKKKYQLTKGQ